MSTVKLLCESCEHLLCGTDIEGDDGLFCDNQTCKRFNIIQDGLPPKLDLVVNGGVVVTPEQDTALEPKKSKSARANKKLQNYKIIDALVDDVERLRRRMFMWASVCFVCGISVAIVALTIVGDFGC